MKHKLATILLLVVALVVATFSVSTNVTTPPAKAAPNDPDVPPPLFELNQYGPTENDNKILKWDEELLQTIRDNPAGTGPTITARAIGVLHTATYDAWAHYDPVAVPTKRPTGWTRRPAPERTPENKDKAISFAAYKTLVDLFPGRKSDYDAQMAEFSYSLTDTTMPATVGNTAAQRVIDDRHIDGSNQLNGYADTTGYQPKNKWDTVNDRWAWQPLCVPNPSPPPGATLCPGGAVQKPLTPHWKNVKPFALFSAWQYEVPGPAKNPDGSYSTADIVQEYNDSKDLSDVNKVKAEYWADGPKSEFPPGHWAVFAQVASRRRNHSVDTDAKMFFALGNALLDASITSWALKYKYDFVRPITAIREHYRDQQIRSWLGPYQGYGWVSGQNWIPYQAPNVITPPFPEYTSGHSTFSAAGARVLNAFTTSDVLGASVTIKAGKSLFEPADATHPVGTPANDVTLTWPTYTAAAAEAGWSRRWGGIHFKTADEHARMLGTMVGTGAWNKTKTYFNGTAPPG
jgi:PAP2 superfamily